MLNGMRLLSERELAEIEHRQNYLFLYTTFASPLYITLTRTNAIEILEQFTGFPPKLQLFLLKKIKAKQEPDLFEALHYSAHEHMNTILKRWFQTHASNVLLAPEIAELIGRSFDIESEEPINITLNRSFLTLYSIKYAEPLGGS